jgi:hypothetical protein
VWGTKYCVRVLRTASCPASLAGCLPGLPGVYVVYETRDILSVRGTKCLVVMAYFRFTKLTLVSLVALDFSCWCMRIPAEQGR